MKTLLALVLPLIANVAFASPNCKSAMIAAAQKFSPAVKIQTTNITPIGDEPVVEVTSLVYGWVPHSDTNSGYYYLVTATCRSVDSSTMPSAQIDNLVLSDDIPDEGGVTVKVITKARY